MQGGGVDNDIEEVRCEVLICGAGAIGATFARYLAPHFHVIMAEAGEQLSKKPGEHLKNSYLYQKDVDAFSNIIRGHLQLISIPYDESYIDTIAPTSFNPGPFLRNGQNKHQKRDKNLAAAASAYCVGGMLTHWTCAIPRHHPELERRLNGEDYLEDPKEWDLLYGEMERMLKKSTDLFTDSARHKVVLDTIKKAYEKDIPEGPYGVQPLPMAGQRTGGAAPYNRIKWTGVDDILEHVKDGEKFQILTQHLVKKVVYQPVEGGKEGERFKAHYAVVRDLNTGKLKHIYADYFVVACNSVLTPQVLWASGIGRNANPTEERTTPAKEPQDLPVGHYLTEQPIAFCQIILHKDLVEKAAAVHTEKHRDIFPGDKTGLRINEPPPNVWIPCSTGTYNYYNHRTKQYEKRDRTWHCQIHRDAFNYGEVTPNVDERVVVDMRWFGALRPIYKNRVEFITEEDGTVETDRFGMPQPTFNYRIPKEDRACMHEMMKDMAYAASALGGYFPGSEPRWTRPGLGLHMQGTFRMGKKNDGKSVCDNNSRVWLFNNLYVGGNGIIPTITASNPTLTSCALAFKAATSILVAAGKIKDKQQIYQQHQQQYQQHK
jgi:pyranose oxidase